MWTPVIAIAVQGHGARLQCQVEPDNDKESQGASRSRKPLWFADGQPDQTDVSRWIHIIVCHYIHETHSCKYLRPEAAIAFERRTDW
jgi:hypothetical protein